MRIIRSGQEGSSSSQERLFATSHLLGNLRNRTISAGLITVTAQSAQFAFLLGSTAVLARLLNPHDYGLIAMVATVLGFLRIFNDAGLTTVTIQREDITNAQVSNLFWINVLVAGSTTMLIAASAPLIAWFYREPDLIGITLALSGTFLLTGLTAQHTALLQRQMRFMAVAAIQLISMVCSIVVGIGMAWRGWGYWALVGQQLAQSSSTMVLTWLVSGWQPQLPSGKHEMRSLVSFGAHLATTNFIWSVARGADGLLVGRIYGSESLGLYSRAGALLNRPLEQVQGPMNSVFIPVLSRLQDDPDRYRRNFLQIFDGVALLSFLVTGLFLALSHDLTVFVLGPKWQMASVIFAAFAPSAVFLPIGNATFLLLASQGRGREWLVAGVFSSSVTFISFVIGAWFGPVWVAGCYSIGGLVVILPVLYHTAGRRGPVSTRDLWTASLQHLPVWVVVVAATFLVSRWIGNGPLLLKLAVSSSVGLATGVAFIWVYPPARRSAMGLARIIRGFRVAI